MNLKDYLLDRLNQGEDIKTILEDLSTSIIEAEEEYKRRSVLEPYTHGTSALTEEIKRLENDTATQEDAFAIMLAVILRDCPEAAENPVFLSVVQEAKEMLLQPLKTGKIRFKNLFI